MRWIFLSTLLIVSAYISKAQSATDLANLKHIEVNGIAEMEISPNEYYLNILAKEYLDDNKKKITIEELERQVTDAVSKAGIPKENLNIADVESDFIKYRRKKEKDLFLSKTYVLKLTEVGQFELLLNSLDGIQLESVELARTSHSEIERYRLQVKVAAVEAAKKKAEAMLAPFNAKVGKVIYIHEISDEYLPPLYNQNYRAEASKLSNSVVFSEASAAESGDVGFKKIKLRYQVLVRLEIEQ